MDKCPKCKGKAGYYRKLRTNYEQHYNWDGNPVCAIDGRTYGGKRVYCSECGKDITKYID